MIIIGIKRHHKPMFASLVIGNIKLGNVLYSEPSVTLNRTEPPSVTLNLIEPPSVTLNLIEPPSVMLNLIEPPSVMLNLIEPRL